MARRDYGERELELLAEVLGSGELCSIDGEFTHKFEEAFARTIGTKYAVAMNSAMSVLHASVMCAGAGAGSEVICDPVFVFGAQAVLYANAVPRFVDIVPDTHEMDPDKLEAAINERTKAVIVTHAWGLPAEMDRIVEIAHRRGLIVIEDCAHAILATYKGRHTGSWGDIGSFSFQGSKQMALGDGGMATTTSEELAKQLDLHAGAPTFHCVAYGLHYNYRMNEITSAVGLAQLEKLPELLEGLRINASHYDQAVSGCKWLKLQAAPDATSTYHLWAATFRGEDHGITLDEFKKALKQVDSCLSVGYTEMPAYEHPVIKDRLAHAFHCQHNQPEINYAGCCPVAERTIPNMVLAYTMQTEEKAKEEAEKLHRVIARLEGR